jgi:hypothetical protein
MGLDLGVLFGVNEADVVVAHAGQAAGRRRPRGNEILELRSLVGLTSPWATVRLSPARRTACAGTLPRFLSRVSLITTSAALASFNLLLAE